MPGPTASDLLAKHPPVEPDPPELPAVDEPPARDEPKVTYRPRGAARGADRP